MTIGAFLRRQREASGLTQREFARRAGIATATVSSYENGRRTPSIPVVEALLAGVGLQLCWAAEPVWPAGAGWTDTAIPLSPHERQERVDQVPVLLDWWYDRLRAVPFVLDGPFAALVQGAPVLARWLELALQPAALDALAAVFAGIANLQRWSERRHDWTHRPTDPRSPGPRRWRTPYGEVRVRLVSRPPASIDVLVAGLVWPVRPLSDVDTVSVPGPDRARLAPLGGSR